MRKNELSFLVLSVLDINFNLVTHFEVRVVAELRSHNDTLALVADVDNDLPLSDRGHDAFYDLAFYDLRKGLLILCGVLLAVAVHALVLECVPVEVLRLH